MSVTPLSYSHDLTRDEIIARYRDRISQDKRSKLGKSELEQLILHLIDRLKTLAGQSEIKALCDAEIALLEEGYKTNTVAFDYLPKYRKAVEKAIADGIIQTTPNNSHRYIHIQRVTGIEEERLEHYALTYLKYDADTYEKLDTRSQETNRSKQLNLKGVNPHLYLDKLGELLYSNDKFAARHQAIAIAGLTGRRLNEVLARGRFSLSDHPFLLKFEGHSKVQRDAYNIVTLIESDRLLPFLETFRKQDEIQPLLTLTGEELATAINQFDVQVNRECNKYLADIVPPLEGREAVSVHNLRGLWGAIAAYFFCPPTSHEYPFLQHYLGHALDSSATGHYFRYRLIDDSGNYLEQRGVKNSELGELPLPDSQQVKTVVVEEVKAIADTMTETFPENLSEVVPRPHSPTETYTVDGQLVLTLPENTTPLLSLLPTSADESLAQSLQIPLSQLLLSDRYTHLLTGLMAVTGRGAGELLKSKKFYSHPDETFALLFSPTVATSYDHLITLVEGQVVLDALTRLKAHPDVQPLLYLSPNVIDSRCLPYINKTLHSHLPFSDIDEMLTAYGTLVGASELTHEAEKPKRPPTTIYNLYTDDRHRLEALADSLGFSGTQAAIFHALLNWVEGHLKEKATLIDVHPHDSLQAITEQAKTLSWLTNEITTLRERVTTLEQERDGLKSQLTQASTPDPQIESLKSANDRLEAELEKANSTLSVFRQLLNGNDDGTGQPPGVKSKTLEPTVTPEPFAAMASPSVELSQAQFHQAIAISPQPEKKHRRPRHDGGARARAIAIWNALQRWNLQHRDHTFALTPALLEVTFHIHRAAAHEFIDEYQAQIDDHHRAIGVTTLRTHNRGKDIALFKSFVEDLRPH